MASQISFGNCNSGLQVGSSNAPITAHFHVKNERPETPPCPLSTVPFRRDKDFVECGTIFDEINEKSRARSPRIALVGLGGVGKSQLAIEYSYRMRERSPETWIFWVHASNAARFEQSFREIADRVKIPGRENPTNNIFQLVHEWLQDESKGKWILILDNVDDDRFLQEAPLIEKDAVGQESDQMLWRPLQTYLPQNTHGFILITTRNKGVALRMVEEREIIMVQPMDQAHAQKLFEVKLGMQDSTEDILQLAAALEYMPLALVQAAAYIKQRAPRSSVKQYLEQFQSSDNNKLSLLEYEKGQLRRDREAKNSIIRTWQISFDHLRQERPSAANLLSLMSFFNRQAIHESLLPIQNQETGDDTAQQVSVKNKERCFTDVEDPREEDFCTLRDYCFITVNTDATSFAMHRLVQLATQKWLEEHGELEKWKGQFIANIYNEYLTEPRDLQTINALIEHFLRATTHGRDPENVTTMWFDLLYLGAVYQWERGNTVEAEALYQKAKKAMEHLISTFEDPAFKFHALNRLAPMLLLQGKYKEAEIIYREVGAGFEEFLGSDDWRTLLNLGDIAAAIGRQGRFAENEAFLRDAVKRCEQAFGTDAPVTVVMYKKFGEALMLTWKLEEAQSIQKRCLITSKKALGPKHPFVLSTMKGLAITLAHMGRYQEALGVYQQELALHMQQFGPRSPVTLLDLSSLATLLIENYEHAKAEKILREALHSLREVLGPEHPDTLSAALSLSIALAYQLKNLEEAERIAQEVLAVKKKQFGTNHTDTAFAMRALAYVFRAQYRHSEAVELLKTSIRIICAMYNPDAYWPRQIMYELVDSLNRTYRRETKRRSKLACNVM